MPSRSKPAARRPAAARTSTRTPPAKRAAKPAVERRETTRLDVLWQLNVEVLSQPMPVSAREISATGFSIETTTPFEDGAVHEFRFTLDGGPSAELTAESAHSQPTERVGELQLYSTGFKFVELTTEDKKALKTLLGTIQEYLELV